MTDDRSHAGVGHAQAGREAEVGWEPPDWAAVLRRRRLRQWGGAAFLLLVAVTERAEKIDTVSGAALLGWPLVTALFVVPLVAVADHPAARIGIGLVGLLVGVVLVRRNRRRVRWARRWLADPLPRDVRTP